MKINHNLNTSKMGLKSTLLKNSLTKAITLGAYRKIIEIRRGFYLATAKPNYGSKVFCIGYQKTGTTTLGRSLKMLGYNHSSFDHETYLNNYKYELKIDKIIDYTSKFESFDDMPWLKIDIIPILDQTFPNSKFIYLERDEESWKKSMNNWHYKKFGHYPDIDQRLREYRAHKEFVMEYFKDRLEKDLIILNIKDKHGFKKLSSFLGKTAPMDAFPHFNKTELVPSKVF